ncbi:MAG: hypothetical protein ACK5LE_02905 [Alphaproteobacteria bacterium]
MKKIAATIILGSVVLLSACNQKQDDAQAKMDEAQEMLAQATELLQKAQEMQQKTEITADEPSVVIAETIQKEDKNSATSMLKGDKQTPVAKPLELPDYQGWVKECVDLRNAKEGRCRVLETGAEQSACLLAASRDMGLCMADHGAAQLQDKMIDQGTQLGEILGSTVQELDNWLQQNESSLDDVAGVLTPFMDQLMQSDNGEAGKNIQELLQKFGEAVDGAINQGTSEAPTPTEPTENSKDPIT